MKYQSVDDLYRTRRIPWVPILLGIALVAVGLAYFLRKGDRKDGTREATPPVESPASATDAGQGPGPGTSAGSAAPAVPSIPAEELGRVLASARELEAGEDLAGACGQLLSLLEDKRSLGAQRLPIEQRLGTLHIQLVTSPRPMPGKVLYVIQKNDSLSKIAAKFNCPAELIQRANGIANPSLIRPGNSLHVLDHPTFAIEVGKRDNTLVLTLGGRFFKRYRIATGAFGRTPVGTFTIRDKIVEPPWWHPDGRVIPFGDPENILGTRWLAITATGDTPPVSGYGIHGTWDDASIGKAASAGCVRMLNADVEELHMLVPRGTPVTIHE